MLANQNTIMSLYMFQSPQTGVLYKQCNKQLAPIVLLVCQNLLSEEIRPISPMLLTINQKNRLQSRFSEEFRAISPLFLTINQKTGLQTSHHRNLGCQQMQTSRNMLSVSIGYNSAKQEVLFQNILWLTCCGTGPPIKNV